MKTFLLQASLFKLSQNNNYEIFVFIDGYSNDYISLNDIILKSVSDYKFAQRLERAISYGQIDLKVIDRFNLDRFLLVHNWQPNKQKELSREIIQLSQVITGYSDREGWYLIISGLRSYVSSNEKKLIIDFHNYLLEDKEIKSPFFDYLTLCLFGASLSDKKIQYGHKMRPLNQLALSFMFSSTDNDFSIKKFSYEEEKINRRHSHPKIQTASIDNKEVKSLLSELSKHEYAAAGGFYDEKFHFVNTNESLFYTYNLDANELEVSSLNPILCDGLKKQIGSLVKDIDNHGYLIISFDLARLERKYGLLSWRLSLLNTGVLLHHAQLIALKFNIVLTPYGGMLSEDISLFFETNYLCTPSIVFCLQKELS